MKQLLMQKYKHKLNPNKLRNIFFWTMLTLITYVNIFIVKLSPEFIILIFGLLIIIFKKNTFKQFRSDWIPFFTLFFGFAFLRSIADNISPFYNHTISLAYLLEIKLFPFSPLYVIQEKFLDNWFALNISYIFYTGFFYYSFIVAYLIWLKNSSLFRHYAKGYFILGYSALIIYILAPTAPPWLIAKSQDLILKRPFYTEIVFRKPMLTYLYFFIGDNPVAALPSLHVAWPAYTTLFIIKSYKNKLSRLLLFIPISISFAVMLLGEHFLIDIITGWLWAYIVIRFIKRGKLK